MPLQWAASCEGSQFSSYELFSFLFLFISTWLLSSNSTFLINLDVLEKFALLFEVQHDLRAFFLSFLLLFAHSLRTATRKRRWAMKRKERWDNKKEKSLQPSHIYVKTGLTALQHKWLINTVKRFRWKLHTHIQLVHLTLFVERAREQKRTIILSTKRKLLKRL